MSKSQSMATCEAAALAPHVCTCGLWSGGGPASGSLARAAGRSCGCRRSRRLRRLRWQRVWPRRRLWHWLVFADTALVILVVFAVNVRALRARTQRAAWCLGLGRHRRRLFASPACATWRQVRFQVGNWLDAQLGAHARASVRVSAPPAGGCCHGRVPRTGTYFRRLAARSSAVLVSGPAARAARAWAGGRRARPRSSSSSSESAPAGTHLHTAVGLLASDLTHLHAPAVIPAVFDKQAPSSPGAHRFSQRRTCPENSFAAVAVPLRVDMGQERGPEISRLRKDGPRLTTTALIILNRILSVSVARLHGVQGAHECFSVSQP